MSDKYPASNTKDCFRSCVGHKVTGYFNDGKDSHLVLDDGRALVFHHETGAYWISGSNDVQMALGPTRERLQREIEALKDVLLVAGVVPEVKP